MSSVLFSGDSFGFLHEQSSETLVLELAGVSGGNGDDAAVNVEFANHRYAVADFRPKATEFVVATSSMRSQYDKGLCGKVPKE